MEYEAVIGLEVHAHLLTASKIFCGCATAFGAPPNTQVCEVCLGMPGSLPVLNRKAVEFALKMALATNCRVNPESVFARKNYFYPDLPKGYQISQYELPLAEHGFLDIKAGGAPRRIGITRIHMEEDAGKLIHSESRPVSFVDFNRTGVPLIEIVSEPDLRTPEEAVEYLKGLRNILLYLEICDGNMEEGSLRCDANISLRPKGQAEFGTRTELKNMNSFRFVKAALEYEIKRQRALLAAGREIVQETRLWDTAANQTVSMRGKEEAHDYRYFPDPDLVPIKVDAPWLASLSIAELPVARLKRFQADYDLPEYDAEVLTSDKALADYFEAVVQEFPRPKQVSNWIMGEFMRELKEKPASHVNHHSLGFRESAEIGRTGRHQRHRLQRGICGNGGHRPQPRGHHQGKRPGPDQRRLGPGISGPGDHQRQPPGSCQLQGGQDQSHGFLCRPTHEKNQRPGQPPAGQ